MGKGSTRRTQEIDDQTMKSNWDAIFGKTKDYLRTCPICGEQHQKDEVHKCELKDRK